MSEKPPIETVMLADRLFSDIEDILEVTARIENMSFDKPMKERADTVRQMLIGMAETLSKIATNGQQRLEQLRKSSSETNQPTRRA